MAADISRVRFDPHRDFAGVVMQQGRLLLDADWNELVAILQRRLAATALDFGAEGPDAAIAGISTVSRATPDAFKVTLTAGALTIGRGRMYVDGLLAENHGIAPDEFDPVLSETTGSADTPYDKQPYGADPLPGGGTHLAYLDVWQREVTAIEQPDLVEPAVGVDATARTQTAWRVRLHRVDGGVSCGTSDDGIPGWADAIAPSGARLTVGTIDVDDDDDPCALPPTGGYRGPEHQTYRVEVHDGGAPGAATFVWSRDNASVVTPVLEVLDAGGTARPASLGKDDVLRFSDDDWVEITDDVRELAGVPGELRRIEVHEEDGTVALSAVLPADLTLTAADAAIRHLRMRRWDQAGTVRDAGGATVVDLDAGGATGAIPVPASAATQVVLEHGLVVSFSTTGAPFRPGDHWIFPARAADAAGGALDEPVLTAAPPLGIHHHYARLGMLTFPDGETDCRTPWPSCDCEGGGCADCTVCVTPESHASGALTIQQAVDEVVARGGGTVCLDIGVYRVDEGGVRIERGVSVRLRGQGVRTMLVTPGDGLRIAQSAFVTVERLSVLASGVRPAIAAEATAALALRELVVLMLRTADAAPPAIALSGIALGTTVTDSVVIGAIGVGNAVGDQTAVLTAELEISGNLFVCRDSAVALDGVALHLLDNRVAGNTIMRCAAAGIRVPGALVTGSTFVVADNTLRVDGHGVQVGSGGFEVRGNEISGTAQGLQTRGDGVAVTSSFASLRGPTRIDDNRIRDVGGRAIAAVVPVSTLDIDGNIVERAQHGIVMDGHARADVVSVAHNTVTDVGSRAADEAPGTRGIRVIGAGRATVESNTVHGVGAAREMGGASIGIEALAVLESHLASNSVDRVGVPEASREEIGIAVRGRISRCLLTGNTARRQPVAVDEDDAGPFQGLVIGANAPADEPNAAATGDWVFGVGLATFVIGPLTAFAAVVRDASVTVDANVVSGSAKLPAALVGVGGDVVVTANHVHTRAEGAAALRVVARSAAVAQNRLRGGIPSADIDVDPKRVTVLGNLSTTPIQVGGSALEARWANLNQTGF
jgi:hypothetical protein